MQHQSRSTSRLLFIAALGIVYGDIGTSPLYALREVFHGPHAIELNMQNIFGILSLITWALLFIISLKYLCFVMRADNKGEGGVLALTSLAVLQKEKKDKKRNLLLYLGLFGAALMVSDSMITPAISVLSAVEGLKVVAPGLDDFILPITFFIVIILFYFQHKGTIKIGSFFGPIMLTWFVTIAFLGLGSIINNPEILLALNPYYAVKFCITSPHLAFLSSSAVFLVVTGGESLYADMGHLGRSAITKGWFYVALPGLLLNYFGQGALLFRDASAVTNPFFLLAPSFLLVPVLLIATMAAVIASQAVISGLFSLASQCIQLGYAPRMKVVHTSDDERGQIYVPAVNWIILVGTLWIVIEFESSSNLAAAYGIAISAAMVITSILTSIVAYNHWQWKLSKVIAIFSLFFIVDCLFFSANMLKLANGGWVPLMIAGVCFTLMTTWRKGRTILYERLLEKSYPFRSLLNDLEIMNLARVPGTAVFMVGDIYLTPPALLHNLKHNKVLHETVIFLTVITEDVPRVPDEEKVQTKKLANGFYRVTGHYGFSENPDILDVLVNAQIMLPELRVDEPTFFLGREILVAGTGQEMSFWRKIVFTVMTRNAESANSYFKLPLDRVIEVGMRIEL
ncbi:MAG: potassium transporter Kup [Bdellovibrionales bacterium RBG_16_40_8]|nr:MAG: potassium transporter Kup [Bdellovibrionales bacterium RBG_16_40_8]